MIRTVHLLEMSHLDEEAKNQHQVQGHHTQGACEGDEVSKEWQQASHKSGDDSVAASHNHSDHKIVGGVAPFVVAGPVGLQGLKNTAGIELHGSTADLQQLAAECRLGFLLKYHQKVSSCSTSID